MSPSYSFLIVATFVVSLSSAQDAPALRGDLPFELVAPNAFESFRSDLGQACLLETVDERWDGSQWLNNRRHEYACDEAGRQTVYELQHWEASLWIGQRRWLFAYDAAGNMVEEIRLWNNEPPLGWQTNERDTLLYGPSGNLTEMRNQILNPLNQEWDTATRHIYFYNEFDSLTEEIFQDWADTLWLDKQRHVHTFDPNGNRIESVEQCFSRRDARWENKFKSTFFHDALGRLTDRYYESWIDGAWSRADHAWMRNFYNSSGQIEEVRVQHRDPTDSYWSNSYRNTRSYSALGDELERVYQQWDETHWRTAGRHTYAYEESGNLVRILYQEWSGTHWWHPSNRTTHLWSTRVAVDMDGPYEVQRVENYPNPFSSVTTISYSLAQPAEAALSVFDLLGRQIRVLASGTQPAGTYEVTFDAAGLPSGVYLYRLEAGNFVETRRMVVVR
jgi:hypothetical protein